MENDIWLNGVKIRENRHFGVLSVMANRWHCGQMIAEDLSSKIINTNNCRPLLTEENTFAI